MAEVDLEPMKDKQNSAMIILVRRIFLYAWKEIKDKAGTQV
jgi:hypothetical protein